MMKLNGIFGNDLTFLKKENPCSLKNKDS